jgi:hypothetical protein
MIKLTFESKDGVISLTTKEAEKLFKELKQIFEPERPLLETQQLWPKFPTQKHYLEEGYMPPVICGTPIPEGK